MKRWCASLFGLLALASGVLGTLLDDTSSGRLVESEAERSAVVGAACYAQAVPLMWICFGGLNSDCTGCGCTQEHQPIDGDQGYAAPAVNCNNDAHCTYPFRRGSCTGGG
jgi:hypothetical protein